MTHASFSDQYVAYELGCKNCQQFYDTEKEYITKFAKINNPL
jgi:hypothetical protein